MMRIATLALLLIVFARQALAQPADSPPLDWPTAKPSYGGGQYKDGQQKDDQYDATLSKSCHLARAAEHLEAAGLSKEANEIQAQAMEEFNAEHPPVKQSHQPPEPQIQLKIRIIELSRTKLQAVDSKRYGGNEGTSVLAVLDKLLASNRDCKPTVEADSKLIELLRALRNDHLIKVLSDPSIDAVPDRPASFWVGGEVSYRAKDEQGKDAIRFAEYGTHVDCRTHRVSDKQIKLDAMISLTELAGANSIGGVPALKRRSTEFDATVHLGRTIVLEEGMEQRAAIEHPSASVETNPKDQRDLGKVQQHTEDVETLVEVTPMEGDVPLPPG